MCFDFVTVGQLQHTKCRSHIQHSSLSSLPFFEINMSLSSPSFKEKSRGGSLALLRGPFCTCTLQTVHQVADNTPSSVRLSMA